MNWEDITNLINNNNAEAKKKFSRACLIHEELTTLAKECHDTVVEAITWKGEKEDFSTQDFRRFHVEIENTGIALKNGSNYLAIYSINEKGDIYVNSPWYNPGESLSFENVKDDINGYCLAFNNVKDAIVQYNTGYREVEMLVYPNDEIKFKRGSYTKGLKEHLQEYYKDATITELNEATFEAIKNCYFKDKDTRIEKMETDAEKPELRKYGFNGKGMANLNCVKKMTEVYIKYLPELYKEEEEEENNEGIKQKMIEEMGELQERQKKKDKILELEDKKIRVNLAATRRDMQFTAGILSPNLYKFPNASYFTTTENPYEYVLMKGGVQDKCFYLNEKDGVCNITEGKGSKKVYTLEQFKEKVKEICLSEENIQAVTEDHTLELTGGNKKQKQENNGKKMN